MDHAGVFGVRCDGRGRGDVTSQTSRYDARRMSLHAPEGRIDCVAFNDEGVFETTSREVFAHLLRWGALHAVSDLN